MIRQNILGAICAPETYYSLKMQSYMRSSREGEDKKWIHDLIAKSMGQASSSKESIILNHEKWFMCHNIIPHDVRTDSPTQRDKAASKQDKVDRAERVHRPRTERTERTERPERYDKEPRYLVIFKDEELSTLRDLRAKHTGMLRHMQEIVLNFLFKTHPSTWHLYRIFFHYLPSVFQLHAHVSARRNSLAKSRQHYLVHVLRNLTQDSVYYTKCLIVTSLSHQLRRQNLYEEITVPCMQSVTPDLAAPSLPILPSLPSLPSLPLLPSLLV